MSSASGTESSSPTTRNLSLGPSVVLPALAGEIFELLHEIPVRNVVHAIHAHAVDGKVRHPAQQVGFHQLPGRREIAACAGDGIVAGNSARVAPEPTAEAVARALPGRLLGIRIVRRELRVDVEVIEVDVLQRRARAEGHHHVDDEADAEAVAGGNQLDEVHA